MNLNKVILIGQLGRDPELRHTEGGSSVANFSIATTERWKDKQGAQQERTEWSNIVAWGKQADFAKSYLTKGTRILVEGRLQTRDWEKDGVKHYKTEIVADRLNFMDAKGKAEMADEQGPVADEEPSDEDIGF